MLNDDEIRFKGMNALIAGLGRDDTQTFLKLLANTEPFDYLKWRKEEFGNETLESLFEKLRQFENERSKSELVS